MKRALKRLRCPLLSPTNSVSRRYALRNVLVSITLLRGPRLSPSIVAVNRYLMGAQLQPSRRLLLLMVWKFSGNAPVALHFMNCFIIEHYYHSTCRRILAIELSVSVVTSTSTVSETVCIVSPWSDTLDRWGNAAPVTSRTSVSLEDETPPLPSKVLTIPSHSIAICNGSISAP